MKLTRKKTNTSEEIQPLVEETQIAKKFEGFDKNLQTFKEYSTNLVIESEENLSVAENNSGVVNDTLKNVEQVRKLFGEPYRLTVNSINEYAKKTFTEPLEKIKAAINTAITNYKVVQQAAAKEKAEKEAEEARQLAEKKSEEFNTITRYQNQLIGRMYGGTWTIKSGEKRSSEGCLNTNQCKELRNLITNGMPPVENFNHCKDEYISMKDNMLAKLAKLESLIIESKSSDDNKSRIAKTKISKLRIKTESEINQTNEENAKAIEKEESKAIKTAQQAVTSAGSGVRKTLVIELDDISQVPEEWLIINEKAIREWAYANKDYVRERMKDHNGIHKGIKFSLKQSYASR